jgi:heme-degrading monooxygenase HmoA
MYTATMRYSFKPEYFEEACRIWNEEVMQHAKGQKGFVRMQFLVRPPEAMAIGTWETHEDAQNFMQTGVFVQLMKKTEHMQSIKPRPEIWDLKYFEQA